MEDPLISGNGVSDSAAGDEKQNGASKRGLRSCYGIFGPSSDLDVYVDKGPSIAHIQHLEVDDVYTAMSTSPQGLSKEEVARRLQIYGENRIREPPKPSLLWRGLSHFTHLMAILLWVAGALAFVGDGPVLAIAIWMVNLLNGSFSFYQEFQADQAADALRNMLSSFARVIRGGEQMQIRAEELVPGDVIIVDEGEKLSVDCRVVDGTDLLLDQSTFTGEARTRAKSADPEPRHDDVKDKEAIPVRTSYRNLLFSGTSVVAGTGKAVVLATGMATEFGRVAELALSVEEAPSPLQVEMKEATKVISMIAMSIGVVIFVACHWLVHVSFHNSSIFAIGMVVAFIPEGLLPLVTLSLARASLRMAAQNAIVKRLSAVETLGCTSAICTDKTGTLTRNEMSVSNVWIGGAMLSVVGEGYSPEPPQVGSAALLPDTYNPHDPEHLKALLQVCCLCNNSQLVPPNRPATTTWTILGDPTEAALLALAGKGGLNQQQEEEKTPRVGGISFSSVRKRMTTIHTLPGQQQVAAMVKGGPNIIMDHCTTIRWGTETLEFTPERRRLVEEAERQMARDGQRVLAMAIRHIDPMDKYDADTVEQELTFLGLVGMLDPPRDGVVEAVAACQRAGIRVIMITGDQTTTAKSIAEQIGMRSHKNLGEVKAVSGAQLATMSNIDLVEVLQSSVDLVFARTLPQDKMRVVATLQKLGHVVAVTGDGVNDAPALKQADIGVAMGTGGTDVAKQSSEIILMDNSFRTIVLAVEEGRAVYDNIKKFLTYILTSNMAEAVPFVFFIVSEGSIPLALPVLVVLAIDLGTDMIPALALGADPPLPGTMERAPRNLEETFFKPGLLFRGLVWLGLFQGGAAMFGYYYYFWHHGHAGKWTGLPSVGTAYSGAVSMAFAAVVLSQVGNVFACRSDWQSFTKSNPFNNSLIWVGIVFELAFLAFSIYIPGFQSVFHTAPVPIAEVLALSGFSLGIMLWSDLGIFLAHLLWPDKTLKPKEIYDDSFLDEDEQFMDPPEIQA